MQKIKQSSWIGPLLSGLFAFIAICQVNFFASWIFYIPLLLALSNATPAAAFKKGGLFGFFLALAAFAWMIPGAERFTGASVLYGIGVFLVAAFILACYNGAIFFLFAKLESRSPGTKTAVINGIALAALVCVGERLLMFLSAGLPWLDMHAGTGLADNDYSIQPASLFGIFVLTFTVAFLNYLFAYFIRYRMWKQLVAPIVLVILFVSAGFLMLKNFEQSTFAEKPFTVAVLAENIAPEIKWDDNTGDMLVQKLLDLNRKAVTLKPDLALWSESAIPWTYKPGDDLLKEILSITAPANITHILGMNTDFRDKEVFNSAYCILPSGTAVGRYDKQHLLSFIEQPVLGVAMPFFSSSGFLVASDVRRQQPLETPVGRAGLLICNEAAIPSAAAEMVTRGAQFLFNISNDGWFNDTYIVRMHFYYARLRAVETRKDLAINCNNGYSGLIKASGEVSEQEMSEDSFVTVVDMQPNNIRTLASIYPNSFVYGCIFYLLGFICFNITATQKRKRALTTTNTPQVNPPFKI